MTTNPPSDAPAGCGTDLNNLSCEFTGLTANSAYTFTVTASSASNVTASSAASEPVLLLAPGTPGRPRVTVTASGNATVEWSPPPPGSGPINGYTVIPDPAANIPAGCGDDIGTRECHFTGLDPTVAYTFQVEAVGPAGVTGSALSLPTVPGAPGVPGTPTVTVNTGSGNATVAWDPPGVGGGPVTGYTLTSNQSITVPDGCTALRSCAFTDLDPTRSYTFEVTAHGPAGDTASANSSTAVRPAPPNPPGTPQVELNAGSGNATVTWTAPVAGGGPVTGYTLTSNQSITVPDGCTALRSCAFTDLDPTRSYTFEVTAHGPAGDTASANSSTAVKPAPPGPPGTPRVELNTGSGKATVTWDPTETGGPLTGYTLTSNRSITVPTGCTDLTVRSCVFSGLDPELSYTFRVTAHGPAGSTASANSSTAVIPAPPGPPGTPRVELNTGSGKATVTWDPTDSGGPLTGYTLTSNQSITVPTGCTDLTVRSCVFTDLDPTRTYTFRVTAHGPAGSTESANSSTAVTPALPGPPRNLQVVNGVPGTVTVSWLEALSGGPAATYSVTSLPAVTPPNGCTNTAQLACVFTGLDPAETYAFVVTATGPAGSTPSVSSQPITPGAPSPPGTPTAVVAGSGSVKVSWTASPSTGGTVSSYTVTSDPVVPPPTGCALTSALTCEFTGLDAAKTYTFLVTAVGPAGRTSSVARSAPVSTAAAGAPGTPTVQFTAAGTVRVTWTAPAGGGLVTDYTVTSEPAVTTSEVCVGVSELSCDFTGLDSAMSYTFLVTANGPAGNTPSAARSASIRPALPGTPAAPTVRLAGPNAVTISWAEPAGGGPVASYSVVSDPALVAPPGCTKVTGFACTFDRLTTGTPYKFRVVAAGPIGDPVLGLFSDPLITGAPAAPARPTVTPTTVTNQVRVSWMAPNEGAGISGYLVLSSPDGLGCDSPATATATSCLVSSLNAATTYTFRVQTLGVANGGDSAFSERSEPFTPGALGAPTEVEVAAADRQIAVSWTRSTSAADRVAYYRATAAPGDATCRTVNGADSDCVIVGLTNLTSYTVTVVAIGVSGTINSAPSAPSIRVRPTAGIPGAPTGVAGAGRGQSIAVSWRAPAWTGDGIGRYVATATSESDAQNCITADASALTCTITGLVNGRQYKVTVVSVGRAASGNSGPSTPVSVYPDLPLSTPTGVVATAGATDLTVRFTAGSGGGTVTNFTATAAGGPSAGPCTTTSATSTASAGTSCVITGVTPGTTYTVTVVANGLAGDLRSAASTPSSPVIAATSAAPVLPLTMPSLPTLLTSSAGATLVSGATTTIAGNGYAPFSGVTLGTYPGPAALTTVVTDSAGAFSIPVTITGAAGSRTIVAAGVRSTGTARYQGLAITVTAPTTVAAMANVR